MKKNENKDILESKKNTNKETTDRQIIIVEYLLLIIIILLNFVLSNMLDKKIALKKEKEKQVKIYNEIIENYNTYIKTTKEAKLYKFEGAKYNEIGSVSKNTELILEDKEVKDFQDVYFKLKYLDYYIKYTDVAKIEDVTHEDDNYINYLPFNINVVSNNPAILYSDTGDKYIINQEINSPVIIKDTDKYYIEYGKKLLYIKSTDVKEIINNSNYVGEEANNIAVILYHYVYSEETKKDCSNTVICHSISQVRSHFDYLKDNSYYTTTLEDLDLWMDGKIRLPKNSVTITIDDGWFLNEMIKLLEEYNYNGSLFLITGLESVEAYKSTNLKIYSHTDNMHYVGKCPGGQGSPIKCLDRDFILNDLKLSREKLNNTTYFSWPFYEYNGYSINLLKEAGFTMAFKGGMYKTTRDVDKFLVPRITIHNTTTVSQFANYVK